MSSFSPYKHSLFPQKRSSDPNSDEGNQKKHKFLDGTRFVNDGQQLLDEAEEEHNARIQIQEEALIQEEAPIQEEALIPEEAPIHTFFAVSCTSIDNIFHL